jgi:putative oxidoreductase
MTPAPWRYSDALSCLLRFMAGSLYACHGAQKLFGAFGSQPVSGKPLMLAAGIIEFAGGLLIAAGLLTRLASFISSGQMAVAYFMSHAPRSFWPIVNHGEAAVLFCFVFLFFVGYGGGSYSLDALLNRAPAPTPATYVAAPGSVSSRAPSSTQ